MQWKTLSRGKLYEFDLFRVNARFSRGMNHYFPVGFAGVACTTESFSKFIIYCGRFVWLYEKLFSVAFSKVSGIKRRDVIVALSIFIGTICILVFGGLDYQGWGRSTVH